MQSRSPILAVLALGMAATVGLGVARFAYALVLPAMRADLGWSYGEAGWLNTTNAMGYLAGALLASAVARSIGTRRMTLAGTAIAILSLASSAVLRDFALLNGARILAGFGGALAFVGGGVLASGLAAAADREAPGRAGLILGIYYASPGLGIALSGIVVPWVIEARGIAGWPFAWWALAALCLPAVLFLFAGTRGLDVATRGAGVTARVPIAWIASGYFLFGAGYIAYMTFMIAFVRDGGGGALAQGAFWATVGCGAVVSAWAWRGVLDRLGGGRAFALICFLCALGAGVPALVPGVAAQFLSAALFGSTFFSVVASTTAFVRRNYPPEAWAAGIGAMTVAFGIGQIVGPIAVGVLNDMTGELRTGMAISAALLALGSALAFVQKDSVRT